MVYHTGLKASTPPLALPAAWISIYPLPQFLNFQSYVACLLMSAENKPVSYYEFELKQTRLRVADRCCRSAWHVEHWVTMSLAVSCWLVYRKNQHSPPRHRVTDGVSASATNHRQPVGRISSSWRRLVVMCTINSVCIEYITCPVRAAPSRVTASCTPISYHSPTGRLLLTQR